MKIKNFVAGLLTVATLTGAAPFVCSQALAEDQEPIDLYHKYLGKPYFQTSYPTDSLIGGSFEGAIATIETSLGVLAIAITGPNTLGVFAVADGAGRLMGGSCAGVTGLDDVVLHPVLGGIEGVKRLIGSARSSEAKDKVIPSQPVAMTEYWHGRGLGGTASGAR